MCEAAFRIITCWVLSPQVLKIRVLVNMVHVPEVRFWFHFWVSAYGVSL